MSADSHSEQRLSETERKQRRFLSLWDIAEALMLLSRLPVPAPPAFRGARAAWAYPVAGVLIAILPATLAVCLLLIGLPTSVTAICAIGALIMVTGGLHEDGLADCADGFWGGAERERRLEIMKDSRVGSYGVLALILSVALRIICLSELLSHSMWFGFTTLIAAAAISRAGMPVLTLLLPSARATGLAARVGAATVGTICVGVGVGVLITTVFCGVTGLVATLIALCGTCFAGYLAYRKIGGYTGDVLGASQQMNEALFMLAMIVMTTQ